MFLLVLLADVAGAQAPVAPGRDATGRSVLSAAAPARVAPASRTIRASQGSGQIRSQFRNAAASRGFGKEFAFGVSSTKSRAVHAGAVRNLFDGSSFGMAVSFAALPGADTEAAFVPSPRIDAPTIPVVEHTGSPAP